MNKELILKYIDRDRCERERRIRMFDYYNGRHEIVNRRMADPSKPNNRVANGYPFYIANSYNGYVFGKPVTYAARDESFNERVQDCFKYNDEQAINSALGLDMGICGVAIEIHYVDEDGMERFCAVDPIGCIDVRDDTIENRLVAVIRYYETENLENNKKEMYVEVLDKLEWAIYKRVGGQLEEISRRPHGYQDVPAVIWENNKFRSGDFEPVITQIDAYNIMQSDAINDQEYFTDAMLALYGIGDIGDDEKGNDGLDDMKQKRVLLMPQDSKAEWLIKSQNDQTPENIKNRLNNDIHKFSGCPDMTDKSFAGNASGVALRYKLLDFEIIASVKQRGIKKALQRRFELLCNIWKTKGLGSWDWRDVQITFKRALPENMLEISQTLSNFGNLLSDQTKRSMIPMDLDEEQEAERLDAQQKAGMSLFAPGELEKALMTANLGE